MTDKTDLKSSRTHYSLDFKALIRTVYKIRRSTNDIDRIMKDYNIDSKSKLYNLASRIDATRPHSKDGEKGVTNNDGYDATRDYTRLYLRDDYNSLKWSKDDDRIMRDHFGKTKIESIGVFMGRSETAVAYHARELGLRNIPKYYDAKKVAPWLGITISNLFEMKEKIGLELFPCCNSKGEVKIILVSTTSLARCLLRKGFWKRLVDKYDADEVFIRDVIESMIALQNEEAVWEPNPWVSHGHTSLNPYSETCFGLFFNGEDKKMNGVDLDPRDLAPEADVSSDSWRRGANGHDRSDSDLEEMTETLDSFAKEEVSVTNS